MVEIRQSFGKKGECKTFLLCSGSVVFRRWQDLWKRTEGRVRGVWVGSPLARDRIPAHFSVTRRSSVKGFQDFTGEGTRAWVGAANFPKMHFIIKKTSEEFSG